MSTQPVLIAGQWRASDSTGTFQANDPRSASAIEIDFPISCWAECEAALASSVSAFEIMRDLPRENIADFLENYADRLESNSEEIRMLAAQETALPSDTRLVGELARTTGQLRSAAASARSAAWCHPVIDTANNLRSCFAPLGPVAVFGPNNFPLAFGSLSGGDFVAAIAAGNPVIGKANSMHPRTTQRLAEEAQRAADDTGMPAGTVQLIYRIAHSDGEKLARDPRLAAIGYTGSRHAGLVLKAAADAVGKPIYVELSSVNPVVILPDAIDERFEEIADELTGSCLMGSGQFCTNPGLIILQENDTSHKFIEALAQRFSDAPVGTLFSQSGQDSLAAAVETLTTSGASLVCGGTPGGGKGFSYANTVLTVDGDRFIENAIPLQTEAFGSTTLIVIANSVEQTRNILATLEGNLTGCIYSASGGSDDAFYDTIAPVLRQRVGRLLNDQMPTGVAVSPAMNHGGPFPATGHPGFTAVGLPGSIVRFSMLQCFDNVRHQRLPKVLQNDNPSRVWRQVDGDWSQSDIPIADAV